MRIGRRRQCRLHRLAAPTSRSGAYVAQSASSGGPLMVRRATDKAQLLARLPTAGGEIAELRIVWCRLEDGRGLVPATLDQLRPVDGGSDGLEVVCTAPASAGRENVLNGTESAHDRAGPLERLTVRDSSASTASRRRRRLGLT